MPTKPPEPRSQANRTAHRRPFRYGFAALTVFAAIATLYLPEIGRGLTNILFLAVLLAAWYGGLGPGLAATALTVAAAIPLLGLHHQFEFPPWRITAIVVFAVGGALISLVVEALHAAIRRAKEANLAKDHFLAILSHELRTPLNPVLAEVSALLEDATLPPEVRDALELTRRNVDLEARLIDDLLDVTRIGRGTLQVRLEPSDAHPLIRGAASTCRGLLESAGVSLHLDLSANHPRILADPARFQQVVWNLLRNAAKFTPSGGSVTIRTRNTPAPANPRLIVEVADTGIGIDPADLERIFHPFEQATDTPVLRPDGLGLGLAIARAITLAHGGRLSAHSEGPGLGATFTLDLPTTTSAEPIPIPAPNHAPLRRPLRILLVEDSDESRHVLERLLARRGHSVFPASTVAQALSISDLEDLDLVLSDISLPDGSGLDLMRRLRALRPIPGVALSGFGADHDRALSLSAGFSEHLTKPIDFQSLEAALLRASPPLPVPLVNHETGSGFTASV